MSIRFNPSFSRFQTYTAFSPARTRPLSVQFGSVDDATLRALSDVAANWWLDILSPANILVDDDPDLTEMGVKGGLPRPVSRVLLNDTEKQRFRDAFYEELKVLRNNGGNLVGSDQVGSDYGPGWVLVEVVRRAGLDTDDKLGSKDLWPTKAWMGIYLFDGKVEARYGLSTGSAWKTLFENGQAIVAPPAYPTEEA